MQTTSVIGLPLARTDYAGAIDWVLAKAAGGGVATVEAANTHVAALSRHDPAFGESVRRFDLVVPDGVPLVWAMNAGVPKARQLTDRVYGPTLMLETLRATGGRPEFRHFLLGGKTSTLEKLEARFARECPDTVIADTDSPPFGEWPEDEFARIAAKIREARANLIWVGLGCPKQEHWIARHKAELPPGVYFGVGAAFAFHAGEVSQAPATMQKFGLEWLYRIAKEPRRLFKRYLVHNSLFLWYLLRDHARAE